MRRKLFGLLGWLAVTFVAAALGSIASVEAKAFYGALQQPGWAPPAWLFGPVWTTLYVLMAVAAWRVWRTHGWASAKLPLGLFCVQLGVNALWSWVFFVWHLGGPAFLTILVLIACLVWLIRLFSALDRPAAIMLLPYLLWVGFASFLNYSVWQLNPALL